MKMPPIEKIYEAYGAIADERVTIGENEAKVTSSGKDKTYTIKWMNNVFVSNDNSSYWQGYPGYPVIAVLMKKGDLPFHQEYANHFKDIPWKTLNDAHKRDYKAVVDEILSDLENNHINTKEIIEEVQTIYQKLEQLGIVIQKKF